MSELASFPIRIGVSESVSNLTGKKEMGVFATRDIDISEIVEECEMIAFGRFQTFLLFRTKLAKFLFAIRVNPSESLALLPKYGSAFVYNHSNDNNAYFDYEVSGKEITLKIFSTKRILSGEEILLNYGENYESIISEPVKYRDEDDEMESFIDYFRGFLKERDK